MKFKGLRLRINFAILFTCLIIAIAFVAFLIPWESSRRRSSLHKIEMLLNAVYQQKREDLANEIFAEQELALAKSFQDMRTVSGISALVVFKLDGTPLLSTHPGAFKPIASTELKSLSAKANFGETRFADRDHAVYGTMIEVIGERVGYLKIYYSLAELDTELAAGRWFFALLLIATLAFMSILLNWQLTHSVLRPVSLLRDAMRRVQQGILGDQVGLSTMDEIGEMGSVFNQMSSQLRRQHHDLLEAVRSKQSYAQKLEETNRALEQLNTGLEEIVQERTTELRKSNRQLREEIIQRQQAHDEMRELEERLARSQKMEALGLLAGGVAHDLNNVLSGIVSYPDLLLLELPDDSPMRKPILTIQDSGQKAAAIVQDLLTLARRGVVTKEVVNLNADIIEDYLQSPEYHKLGVYHPKVRLETDLGADLLNIEGSPVHLKKMLMNLVANAAEAQPGGGLVTLTTRNRYIDQPISGYDAIDEGDFAVLSIWDHGLGISRTDMAHIFEPFYTKKVMGRSGTGLGMAVIWGTVSDHSGYIHVASEEGRGTRIEIYFPVTDKMRLTAKGTIPIEDYQGAGQTILVVDDVAQQREIATQILDKLGYVVAAVSSGEAVVEYLRNHDVDLMVLDMIMDPGIDGLETYQRVLKLHPGQKAIIASGFAETDRVRQAQQLGAKIYIKKPYTLEKIGTAVKSELES